MYAVLYVIWAKMNMDVLNDTRNKPAKIFFLSKIKMAAVGQRAKLDNI